MSTPVLMEVMPSESNVARPCEPIEEEWVAVEGGGFLHLEEYLRRPMTTIGKPHRKPRASVRACKTAGKRAAAKKPVAYFVDHCENTQCSFRPGHPGPCSHQLVAGKRGGRVGRSVAADQVAANPPEACEVLFDLNDSDRD